jgi:hypothetical protein
MEKMDWRAFPSMQSMIRMRVALLVREWTFAQQYNIISSAVQAKALELHFQSAFLIYVIHTFWVITHCVTNFHLAIRSNHQLSLYSVPAQELPAVR